MYTNIASQWGKLEAHTLLLLCLLLAGVRDHRGGDIRPPGKLASLSREYGGRVVSCDAPSHTRIRGRRVVGHRHRGGITVHVRGVVVG